MNLALVRRSFTGATEIFQVRKKETLIGGIRTEAAILGPFAECSVSN